MAALEASPPTVNKAASKLKKQLQPVWAAFKLMTPVTPKF